MEKSSAANVALIEKLKAQMFERTTAYAEAQELHANLDALVAARTSTLNEAVDALSTFTGTVGHDLRGPVRNLAGFATILVEDHGEELGPDGIDAVKKFGAEIKAVGAYIEKLISLARSLQEEENLETIDLGALIAESLTGSRAAHAARVVARQGRVKADPKLARLAIACLVEYAVQQGVDLELDPSDGSVTARGCAPSFLDTIETLESAKKSPDILAAWPPLAFIRICRRMGGKAWVEMDDSGERQLRFTLAA